ncbi:thiamine biosynthesis protein ThiC [Marinomonas sp. MED121]|uniref:thiamine biosynthesis protein ThiC n=1 Tax=Marinomonas sp. MED121 TaxID=314277 RepID=UPI0000690809|nr:thiamine biosynthesis protein ThiC [Marinomonas sp. MED121]EAQ64622.1 thiamine biosynthesis protein ThiC [Marinomonas sp. MED121]
MVITITRTWGVIIAFALVALVLSPYVYIHWQSQEFKRELLDGFKRIPPPPPPPDAPEGRFHKPSDLPQAIFPKAVGTRSGNTMPNHHVVYYLTRKLQLSDPVKAELAEIIDRYSEQRKILQGKIAVEVQIMAELRPTDKDYMKKVSEAASVQADISTRVMRLFAQQQVEIYQLLSSDQVIELELIKHKFAQKMKARIAKDRTKGIFSFESGDIEANEIKEANKDLAK